MSCNTHVRQQMVMMSHSAAVFFTPLCTNRPPQDMSAKGNGFSHSYQTRKLFAHMSKRLPERFVQNYMLPCKSHAWFPKVTNLSSKTENDFILSFMMQGNCVLSFIQKEKIMKITFFSLRNSQKTLFMYSLSSISFCSKKNEMVKPIS